MNGLPSLYASKHRRYDFYLQSHLFEVHVSGKIRDVRGRLTLTGTLVGASSNAKNSLMCRFLRQLRALILEHTEHTVTYGRIFSIIIYRLAGTRLE